MPLLCLLLLLAGRRILTLEDLVWIDNCRTQTAGRRILYYSGSQSVSNCITSVHFYLPANTLTVNFKSKLQQLNGQHIYLNFMVPDASAGSILPPKTASTCIKLNVLGATSVLFQLCEVQEDEDDEYEEDEKYGGWEWRWRWWAGGGYNTAEDADENEDEQQDEDVRLMTLMMRIRRMNRTPKEPL